MGNTTYSNLNEIGDSQMSVMHFIQEWVHVKKTPVPLREVIAKMKETGMEKDTTIYSLKMLVKFGYIRRGYSISNKTSFVQLRTI